MTMLHEHRPGLWLTELKLSEFDVRGSLILTDTHAAVWDTLSHPGDMKEINGLIEGKNVTVIYTHADWDHCWGTAGLTSYESIISQELCLARFSEDVPKELKAKQFESPGHWDDVKLISPTRTFSETLTLDLGSLTLELHHLPGHTLDCLVGFIPEWGILLAGDTVETPLPVVNVGSPVRAWIEELTKWASDPRVKEVIPAHGRIGGVEILHHNINYLQSLLDGSPQPLNGVTDPFYLSTHEENIRNV